VWLVFPHDHQHFNRAAMLNSVGVRVSFSSTFPIQRAARSGWDSDSAGVLRGTTGILAKRRFLFDRFVGNPRRNDARRATGRTLRAMSEIDRMPDGPDPYSQALLRLVPRVGPVVAQLRDELHERDQRRYDDFRAAVEDEIELDELARLVIEHERFGDLLRDSVDAALRTRDEQKIRLLAKSFVSGALAEDEASIDEAEQQTRLIAELDPTDFRAILALRDRSKGYGHPIGCILHELRVTPATANLIYSRLQRGGLVEIETMASFEPENRSGEVELDESWGLSDTARAILHLMDEVCGRPGSDQG
jgi:hypothetical protein